VTPSQMRSEIKNRGRVARAALAAACLAVAVFASMAGPGPGPNAATALVSPGSTPRPLTTGFVDDDTFTDSALRDSWLLRAQEAGSGLIRINVPWGLLVPTEPVSPTNPADPAYSQIGGIDAAVADAHALGFDVMLTAFNAPAWAEGPNKPAGVAAGSWKPDPDAFGQFGQMLATRYSGLYLGLPRVRYFEAWNEPNLSNYLTPQLDGATPSGPSRYRELLNKFYDGVHQAQPDAKVIGGATAPFGDDDPTHPQIPGTPRLHPMVFLRGLFCLDSSLHPLSCPNPPKLDILSAHPINIITAPDAPAASPEDVKIADVYKLQRLLRAADNAGHISPAGFHPLWATEFWWITKPPNSIGVPLATHARWVEQGLYLLWKQGVRTVINYEIRDSHYDPGLPPQPQATTGLFLRDGTAKPAYDAWRFPFVADRGLGSRLRIWGKAPETGMLSIQVKRGADWLTIRRMPVQGGQVFTSRLTIRPPVDLRATVGSSVSLPWHQD
jgi:hypothetical protein